MYVCYACTVCMYAIPKTSSTSGGYAEYKNAEDLFNSVKEDVDVIRSVNKCMYIVIYVRMYVCIYVCMYVCMYTNETLSLCICVQYVCVYVCLYACSMYDVYVYICMYVCMYSM